MFRGLGWSVEGFRGLKLRGLRVQGFGVLRVQGVGSKAEGLGSKL